MNALRRQFWLPQQKEREETTQGKTFPMCKYDSNKDGNFKLL